MIMDKEENKAKASFTTMKESSKDDWEIIGLQFREYAKDLPKRIIYSGPFRQGTKIRF